VWSHPRSGGFFVELFAFFVDVIVQWGFEKALGFTKNAVYGSGMFISMPIM